MLKPLPALDDARLLPPVAAAHHDYFQHAAEHPFDAAAAGPGLRNAWWLAECALAAYADAEPAAAIYRAGGFEMVGGGPVRGARHGGQCYVLTGGGALVVAFRGTQVVKSAHTASADLLREMTARMLGDLLTDVKVRMVPWSGGAGGRVHQGFADSFLELRPALAAAIDLARKQSPGIPLWVTGHSLGGALATLAADSLDGVCGVHVFGAPRVGDAVFARGARFPGWRIRHHADVVPWLPAEIMGFRHVPHGKYLDRHGAPHDEPGALPLLLDAVLGAPAAVRQAVSALSRGEWGALTPKNLIDHSPLVYAIKMWNAYATNA